MSCFFNLLFFTSTMHYRRKDRDKNIARIDTYTRNKREKKIHVVFFSSSPFHSIRYALFYRYNLCHNQYFDIYKVSASNDKVERGVFSFQGFHSREK